MVVPTVMSGVAAASGGAVRTPATVASTVAVAVAATRICGLFTFAPIGGAATGWRSAERMDDDVGEALKR
ncbi:hypothetical protein GCM10009751_34150 [Myceligenerans crystallogenes]|uniref:Uncharacterized protein n=1 Tax=Myceligenerans crystallogenes TaxID=316335 RepID=A0ABP4ZU04_9MICO